MTRISTVIVSLAVFGIICGQISSAQQRQGNLISENPRRDRSRRVIRGQINSPGTRFSRRGQVLPGPRHFQPDTRARPQRLSNTGRQNSLNRLVPTGSNRIRSFGTHQRLGRPNGSRLEALHRQPNPKRTSIAPPSGSRTRSGSTRIPTRISEQLKIFARNLKVINGSRGSPPNRTNAQKSGSNTGLASRYTGLIPRNSGLTMRDSRVTPRKNGASPRNNRMFPRARSASRRSSTRPTVRSPLRIRARLRQISSQGSRPVRRKDPSPSNISNSKSGGAKTKSEQGGRKDMIAIDDIISLVKAIKGNKEPSHVASHDKASGSSGGSKNNGISFANNNGSPKATMKSPQARTEISQGGVQTNRGSLPIDMLTQFAFMNNEGGLFNSLLSNQLFPGQMSSRGSDALTSGIAGNSNSKVPKKDQKKAKKQKTSVIIHPSLQKGNGNSSTKIANTGNPVQDKMLSSLLEQTMRNIREEMQENFRKKLADADLPMPRGDRVP